MTEKKSRRSRFKWFLYILGVLALVAVGLVWATLSFVPGGMSQVHLTRRVPPPPPVAIAGEKLAPGAPAPAPVAPAPAAEPKLCLTYVLPADLLQREVSALFPISEGVEGMLKLVLSNPQFVADADGRYLRVNFDLAVNTVGNPPESYPGKAAVRTQLRFSGATNQVALANAELAEFRFSGGAAQTAESLRPVLQSELATQLNGYVVFKLPKKASWWMRSGLSFVQDVVVENGQVVVVVGR
jgi:hypothetical protein